MVTFDHRDTGTPERIWEESGRVDALAALDLDALLGPGTLPGRDTLSGVDAGIGAPGSRPLSVVVLAAHPDDETLGAAGLVHRLATVGARITYVIASDGESSHPASPSTTSSALARLRREEVVAAVHRVAPGAAVHLLGLPDGGLREQRAALHATVDALVTAAAATAAPGASTPAATSAPGASPPAATGPDRGSSTVSAPAPAPGAGGGVLLVAPWAGDGHRDHRIVGEVAREVATDRDLPLLEYPVWFWHWASPEDDHPWTSMRRLDLSTQELDARRQAMSEHRSQVAPLSDQPGDEALLGAEMLRHFDRPSEVYVLHVADDQSEPAAQPEVPAQASPHAPAQALAAAEPEPRVGQASLGEDFFDSFYEGKADPWGFESRWYEERKRAVTLASLPRRHFRAGLEIGCSTGVLTEALVERCGTVLGVDIAEAPLAAARRRLGDRARLERLTTPEEWPVGEFDLVVLSEVGYYYGLDDLVVMLGKAVASLAADGVLLLCHWRHPVADYPLGGDDVHRTALAVTGLDPLVRHEEEDFVLDVFVRGPAVSVARETGLL